MHYILDDQNRIVGPIDDATVWGRLYERRRVGSTETALFWISTVFLGLDHNFSDSGPPLLFETMVFERETHPSETLGIEVRTSLDEFTKRYSSWDDAAAGHAAAVRGVLALEETASGMIEKRGY